MTGIHFNGSPFFTQQNTASQLQHRNDAWLTTAPTTAPTHDDTFNSDDSSLCFQLFQENRNISTALNDVIEPQVIDYHFNKQDDAYITETSTSSFNELRDLSYTPGGAENELFSPIINSKNLSRKSSSVPHASYENESCYEEAFNPMPQFPKLETKWNNPALTPIEALSFDLSFMKKDKENQLARVNKRTESVMLDGTKVSSLNASPTVERQEILGDFKSVKHYAKLQGALLSSLNTNFPMSRPSTFLISPTGTDGLQTPTDPPLQSPRLMTPTSTTSELHPLIRPVLRKRTSASNRVIKTPKSSTKERNPQPVIDSPTVKPKRATKSTRAKKSTRKVKQEPGSPKVPATVKSCESSASVPLTQQLKEHPLIWEKVVNNKKKGIYPCTHCRDSFSTLYDLAHHMDEFDIHRTQKCPFQDCPWFIIGLTRKAEVKRHCAAQHNYVVVFSEDRNEATDQMGNYPMITGMQGTMLQAAKFPCHYDFCDREFKRKDAFQRHEKLVHSNPDSRFNKRIAALKLKYETEDHDQIMEILNDLSQKKKKNDDNASSEQESQY
ncbi:hypothetical protein WICPIJ_009632 [Wickerhamomyces pijperi]|uniref:C2H2-type domain-containing protein n=1 Tax=Wickerhamomyces pijperi TaxID=599730 RepID=A0A9P8TCM9_WICPI|nr:hypothetical protein WICPIJ_009632 [Wickerhamomyces pijperi]